MIPRFVDIHHHLAYGVDDGPQKQSDMFKMLDRAAEEGIHTIIATSHATPGVQRFPIEAYRQALAEAREYCAASEYDMTILEGCEILYTSQAPRLLQEGEIPTLAGTDMVLVEFSPDIKFSEFHGALQSLASAGYRPVVAHVERYECITLRPSRLAKLKQEIEVFYQMNCGTFLRKKGFRVKRFVEWMLDNDMLDAVATDAHNTGGRRAEMKAAWKYLKQELGGSYAREMTTAAFMDDMDF